MFTAAEFLAAQPFVDPSHIFLAGHSAGDTLTLLSVEATRRFVAAAAALQRQYNEGRESPRGALFAADLSRRQAYLRNRNSVPV